MSPAQSITIGEGSSSSNVVLNITSSSKGLLIPRMTSIQRSAIASPAQGLMVYDVDRHSFFYYNSRSGWVEMRPVPSGTITMWFGDIAAHFPGGVGTGLMKGWVLCGTCGADLGGRFIMGGDFTNIGATGGTAYHTLTESEMPTHSHGVNDPGHSHSVSVGNTDHTHRINYRSSSTSATNAPADDGSNYTYSGDGTIDYDVTTNDAVFTRSLSAGDAGISVNNSGSGQAHENRPPFYTLVYIKKL